MLLNLCIYNYFPCIFRDGLFYTRVFLLLFVRMKRIFLHFNSKKPPHFCVFGGALTCLHLQLLSYLHLYYQNFSHFAFFPPKQITWSQKMARRLESMLPSFLNNHNRRTKVSVPTWRRILLKILLFSFVFFYRLW